MMSRLLFVNWVSLVISVYFHIQAAVVCRQLGYSGVISWQDQSPYGLLPTDVFSFDNLVCSGQETAITACQYFDVDDCGAGEGIGVVCVPAAPISKNNKLFCHIFNLIILIKIFNFCSLFQKRKNVWKYFVQMYFMIKTVLKSTDGNWGDWTSWSTCSVTCGGGTQSRTRLCNFPPPSNGGLICPGSSFENGTCNTQSCLGGGGKHFNF